MDINSFTRDTISSAYRFLSSRVTVMGGYGSRPAVFDAMLFYLPPFSFITACTVQLRDMFLELWSPNSSCHAYYPGVSDGTALGIGLEPSKRRCDGHLGRFDYTISPQHYDKDRPWLGFIKKKRFDSTPENVSLLDVWTPLSLPNYGRFQANFVSIVSLRFVRLLKIATNLEFPVRDQEDSLPKRPAHLTVDGSERLRGIKSLDEAVDTLASVQRDLKELDAWNRMMESVRLSMWNQEPSTEILPADDTLLGVWLNGCDENSGLWLLKNKVPCYIIHEADGEEENRRMRMNPNKCVLMTPRTLLMAMEDNARIYKRKFWANDQVLDGLENDIGIAPYSQIPRSMRSDRMRSTPFGQGWRDGAYHDPQNVDSFETQFEIVLPEKNGKIIPPAVQVALPSGGWTNWVEDDSDKAPSTPHMLSRAKNSKVKAGGNVYYDRVNKRVLRLNEALDIPRHYDADTAVFGVPGPALRFFSCNNGRDYVEQPRSWWVYETDKPLQGDAGREYVPRELSTPPPTSLRDQPDQEEEEECTSDEECPTEVSLGSDTGYSPNETRGDSAAVIVDSNVRGHALPTFGFSQNSRTRSCSRSRSTDRYRGRLRANSPLMAARTNIAASSSRSEPQSRYNAQNERRYDSWRPRYDQSGPRRGRSPSPDMRRQGDRSRSPSWRKRRASSRHYSPSPDRRYRRDPVSSRFERPNEMREEMSTDNAVEIRREIVSRVSQYTEIRTANSRLADDDEDSNEIKPEDYLITPQVLSMFPAPTSAPIPVQSHISQGTSRFLAIWNLPVVYCWAKVHGWLMTMTAKCSKVKLLQILRTNEMGVQVFWLAFNSADQAQFFRGFVAHRQSDFDHLTECDFVSNEDYSTAAGANTDRWDVAKGFISAGDIDQPLPVLPAGSLILSSLAERLGIDLSAVEQAPKRKNRRGKRAGGKFKRLALSNDGGAL